MGSPHRERQMKNKKTKSIIARWRAYCPDAVYVRELPKGVLCKTTTH